MIDNKNMLLDVFIREFKCHKCWVENTSECECKISVCDLE